jgi:hypothetical protein
MISRDVFANANFWMACMRGQHPGLESGLGTADGTACRGIPPDLELCNPYFLPNPSTESRITFFTSPDHASIPSKQLIPLILQIHPTRPPQHFALWSLFSGPIPKAPIYKTLISTVETDPPPQCHQCTSPRSVDGSYIFHPWNGLFPSSASCSSAPCVKAPYPGTSLLSWTETVGLPETTESRR